MSRKTKKNLPPPEQWPSWVTDDSTIIEREFCKAFLTAYPMRCINGAFFTVDGKVPDEGRLLKEIYDWISPWVDGGIANRAKSLLESVRIAAYSPPLPAHCDRIHLANGTYYLSGSFAAEKEFCINRLPIRYDPDAAAPVQWLGFLGQLLYLEDIPTLQEYMGYCLIPSTKAQQMIILVGDGGEGKSRIAVVLNALLGSNMNTGSIDKLCDARGRFALADLEFKLVMVDDDMLLSALEETRVLKGIVTADISMELERKYQQSYQGNIYSRIMGFGNGILKAKNDQSAGFYRRQILIKVREKPENRVDDPYIGEKMCAEAEGIFLWCLEGLKRLIANEFAFTVSDRAKENMEKAIRSGNNLIDFLDSAGYIRFKADYEASTKSLYASYLLWCEDNAEEPMKQKAFSNAFGKCYGKYNLEDTDNIHLPDGKKCRGYVGIEVLQRVVL